MSIPVQLGRPAFAAFDRRRDELNKLDSIESRHTGDYRIGIEKPKEIELTITNGYHRVRRRGRSGSRRCLATPSRCAADMTWIAHRARNWTSCLSLDPPLAFASPRVAQARVSLHAALDGDVRDSRRG